jgi:hypothetical protein
MNGFEGLPLTRSMRRVFGLTRGTGILRAVPSEAALLYELGLV